jgi:hypothetical protein
MKLNPLARAVSSLCGGLARETRTHMRALTYLAAGGPMVTIEVR